VAASLTVTPAVYQPVEHAAALHVIVVVGAVPSIWIACVRTASTLPAVSHERYLTVVVAATEKAPV
jgi:hypothetical protein